MGTRQRPIGTARAVNPYPVRPAEIPAVRGMTIRIGVGWASKYFEPNEKIEGSCQQRLHIKIPSNGVYPEIRIFAVRGPDAWRSWGKPRNGRCTDIVAASKAKRTLVVGGNFSEKANTRQNCAASPSRTLRVAATKLLPLVLPVRGSGAWKSVP
jgi:hypothetical protein